MNKLDIAAFISLFNDAYQKCFAYPIKTTLTESESNLLSDKILESTGLVIGWKSLKNYSFFILDPQTSKQENPSLATLDTFARYVNNVPRTDESHRKKERNQYAYWFQYKEEFYKSNLNKATVIKKTISRNWLMTVALIMSGLLFIMVFLILLHRFTKDSEAKFSDNFDSLSENQLTSHDWIVISKVTKFWNRRGEKPGCMTLFTLKGDNWPDTDQPPDIKNLLIRKIPFDFFTAEVHLTDFIPKENWQQAGIILLEDTSFVGKSLRLSIGYNDFAGGYAQTKEIIVQAITSLGKDFFKPEEIVHQRIFAVTSDEENLISQNLANSALRIEKHGKIFRLLYSNGQMKNSAFKEVVSTEFEMQSNYIGIFALKGFVNNSGEIPAYFDSFNLVSYP
jgi:hypothetical protein